MSPGLHVPRYIPGKTLGLVVFKPKYDDHLNLHRALLAYESQDNVDLKSLRNPKIQKEHLFY